MQQFQDISQANEAALAALNSTHDQYKADAEVRLSRQEVCSPVIKTLTVLTCAVSLSTDL